MNELVMIFVKWVIPFLFTGLFTYFGGSLMKINNSNKAMKNALLAIIRSQIVSKCERYQSEGFCPEYARYCLEDLYKQYKILGGNHGVEILVEQTLELPITKELIKKKGK